MSHTLLAVITNPVIDSKLGVGDGGTSMGYLIGQLYRTMIMLGGLALLIYLIWGGISWITGGGDEKKVEKAKDQISNAIAGMAILVATAAVAAFLGKIFGMDLLNPSI